MGIVTTPDPGVSLGQGDILRASALYWTGVDDEPLSHAKLPAYVLVLSRSCKSLRAKRIIVCPIFAQRLDNLGENYKEAKVQLEVIRDGGRAPDRFYLGDLGEDEHRYTAHLDELYTVEVPEDPAERRRYVEERRIHALDREFLYDLHARLFISFARRGFDDACWYSNRDLEYLIDLAQKDWHSASADLHALRAQLNQFRSEPQPSTKQVESLRKRLDNKQRAADALARELEPLRAEQARRGQQVTRTQE